MKGKNQVSILVSALVYDDDDDDDNNNLGIVLAIRRLCVQLLVGHSCVTTLGKLYTTLCSVTKQYNLLMDNRQ